MLPEDKSAFNFKYLIAGDGKKDWFKAWGLGWRLMITLGLLCLIGLGIYTLFPKPNVQSNTVTAESGSTINIIQKNEQKKAWWMPSPFVEVYTFVEKDNTDGRNGIGGRFGARWEF